MITAVLIPVRRKGNLVGIANQANVILKARNSEYKEFRQ